MKTELVPVKFNGLGKHGDFSFMIGQEKHRASLFVFNDNVQCHNTSVRGGGNACVRPYNVFGYRTAGLDRPRSAGIPTGHHINGFLSLQEAKNHVDAALIEISDLLSEHLYDKVYYSADADGTIGCGIFRVPATVKFYITQRLRETCE